MTDAPPVAAPLITARVAEMAAIFMVGDGLIGLLQPHRHVALWQDRALGTEKLVKPFIDRPGRRRLYAVVQIAAGLALAGRQRAGKNEPSHIPESRKS